jgi:hypothetical protein
VKDILVAGAVVSGAGALVTGTLLDRAMRAGETAIESGLEPAAETTPRVRRLQRTVNTLGIVNIALQAGVMAVTTILAMKSGKSTKWSLISRLLP